MRYFPLLLCLFFLMPSVLSAADLRMTIAGGNEEQRKIVETALSYIQEHIEKKELTAEFLRSYQGQIDKRVKSALQPYGFFDSEAEITVSRAQDGRLLLQIHVFPGKPVRVTALSVRVQGPGEEENTLQEAIAGFPLQVGDILRQDFYDQGKADLKQKAVAAGFLKADYSRHELLVHRAEHSAEVVLLLESGPRYRFGKTCFEGRESYPERLLKRFLDYREGEFYSERKLSRTRMNFVNADLFRTVDIRPDTLDEATATAPVLIELDPQPRHRLRPGVGYGTDSGARISLKYHNLNLLKRGHELQGELLLAEREQSLRSTYVIPDFERLDSRTLLHVGVDREDTDSYLSREYFSEVEYQRSLTDALNGSTFLRLSQEYSRIGADRTRAQMLLPGVRLAMRMVDETDRVQKGMEIKLELLGAQDTVFSDTSLLQLSGQMTGVVPFGSRNSALLRLRGGTTWHNDPFNELPASLRFFAGGDRSVRGYKYQSLGPKDDDGEVIGGKHLLVANLEFERRITENWGGALFYDIGNAFDSFADYELEQGAGIGIRRYTAIGALRLDLARQVGVDDPAFRVHFSVGLGW